MKNKILIFAVMAVLLLGITAVSADIPPRPTNPSNTTGCDYIYFDWDAGAAPGNVSDGYNVTFDVDSDGSFSWSNISVDYYNTIGLTTHKNITVYVYAYNSTGSGNLSLLNLSLGEAVANCPINMTDCTTTHTWNYGSTGSFDLGYTDGDGDTAAFDGNNTFGTFDSTTGAFSWLILNKSDAGTYYWSFNVTESNATVSGITPNTDYCNMTITVKIPTSSRGAPALTPIGIVGAIVLWSAIITLVLRRKKREN